MGECSGWRRGNAQDGTVGSVWDDTGGNAQDGAGGNAQNDTVGSVWDDTGGNAQDDIGKMLRMAQEGMLGMA